MERKSQPKDLVLTQAEPAPPPRNVAKPRGKQESKSDTKVDHVDPEVLRELKRLAERIGGLERLKEVVEVLVCPPR